VLILDFQLVPLMNIPEKEYYQYGEKEERDFDSSPP
jgi:hypothetical protein